MVANLFEKCFAVRNPENYKSDDIIRKGESVFYDFDLDGADLNSRHRLFFTGETQMFYVWKNEPDSKKMYFEIEDALNEDKACKARYCLDLSSVKPFDYVKRVVYEMSWPPCLSYLSTHPKTEKCEFGIYACAENLEIVDEKGFVRLVLEVFDKKPGVSNSITNRVAEHIYSLDVKEGSYPFEKFSIPCEISPDNTSRVVVTLEATGYKGNIYFERPFLIQDAVEGNINVLPDFNTSCNDNEFFDWFGMNISKKEWPAFEISINGKCIFDDELFERCHRYAEMEVAIPCGLLKEKNNRVTFKLKSDYHGTLPYGFREIAVLEQPGGHKFNVIAVPEIANINDFIPILLRTDEDNVKVKFTCESGELSAEKETLFEEKGLNVLKIRANKFCNNAKFCLECDGYSAKCEIKRMTDKKYDRTMTGTSDQVYISQKYEDMEEFLCWYVANGVGKFLTIRPIYRWAGSRKVENETWKRLVKVFDDLGISYAHMVEGRDLPGMEANPDIKIMSGKNFLGRQVHERDGQMYYWGPHLFGKTKLLDIHYNLSQRLFLKNPDNTDIVFNPDNCTVYNKFVAWNHAVDIDDDMKKIADDSVEKLKVLSFNTPRHTGPSIMGKYFYKAGFETYGSELMYGSLEPNVAFLRGDAKSYGKKDISAHHALQWSSSPHDDPAKYRRYRLALYTGYMQGIHQTNTEEGLWHIEESRAYFNRFTEACSSYLKQQNDFAKYIDIHERKGDYYTPIAYVHGNCDGTLGFGNSVFGIPEFKACDAENSWKELLKLFYPLSKPSSSIYVHPCPEKPLGYYSGTPNGNVDAISVEGSKNVLSDYKCIVYAGYNLADNDNTDRLYDYIYGGGTAVLSWAHLSTTTNRNDIVNNRFEIIDHKIVNEIVKDDKLVFNFEMINGQSVEVCTNLSDNCKAIETTKDGYAFVWEIPVGKGKLILFNVKAYPSNPSVSEKYLDTVNKLNQTLISKENSWIECGNDVEFTVYDRKDSVRDIYVLAVDWYNSPEKMREFTLRIGNNGYLIKIPFGVMVKISVKGEMGIYSLNEDVALDFENNGTVSVEGLNNAEICIARDGKVDTRQIFLGNNSKVNVKI